MSVTELTVRIQRRMRRRTVVAWQAVDPWDRYDGFQNLWGRRSLELRCLVAWIPRDDYFGQSADKLLVSPSRS